MTSERWQEIQDLFTKALAQPSNERRLFLDAACEGDAALREEVVSLLQAAESEGPLDALQSVIQSSFEAGPGLEAGAQIGPYRLLSKLGEGGMGAVYLAERDDPQLRQRVALKVVRPGLLTPEQHARFINERQILAHLNHASIARLLDGGVTADGQPYFVMEYIEGLPLDQYCDERRLSVEDRLLLFNEVCAAVYFAHQHLVVHRDLKPSNIMVTAAGEVKLLDFGIAKLLETDGVLSEELHTRTGHVVMTPSYASPEQVRGEAVTTASDVYALGVILYELLTGRRPYLVAGHTPAEIEQIVCEQEPRLLSAVVMDTEGVVSPAAVSSVRGARPESLQRRLLGDLDVIGLKALHKVPARRYNSPEGLAEDIRRHLAGFTIEARPDTLAYRLSKFVRRNRIGVGVGVLLLLSLVGGILGTAWQARRATDALGVARLEAAKAEQVAGFLLDVFRVADPNEAQGDTITARTLLRQGRARAEEELSGQPEMQATMLDAIGQVYTNLGLYGTADSLLVQAVALRTAYFGATHLEVAKSLSHLADLRSEQGDYRAADSLYRAALAIRKAQLTAEAPDLATNLDELGQVLVTQGDYAAAEPLYQQALAIRKRALGAEHEAVATSLGHLATLAYFTDDLTAAERLFRETLAIREKRLDPDAPDLTSTLNNLAVVLNGQGKLAEAEAVYRDALERRTRRLGLNHPRTLNTRVNLALVLHDQGQLAEAEAIYREVLAQRREQLGNDHPSTATTLNNLARVLQDAGRDEEAVAMNREALAIRRKALGETHPYVAVSLHNLAGIFHARGEAAEAVPLYREALAIRLAVLPADHRDIALTQSQLGDCLTRLGRYEEAERLLLQAHEVLASKSEGSEARIRTNLEYLVKLYEAQGRQEEAARYQQLLQAD